jgi:hypothetical protein
MHPCPRHERHPPTLQEDGGQLAVYNTAYVSNAQTTDADAGSSATGSASATAESASPGMATSNHEDSTLPVGWSAGEPATLIAPLGGRLVVFESRVEHEVLPAHAERWALTAWFHFAPPPSPAPLAAPAPEAATALTAQPQSVELPVGGEAPSSAVPEPPLHQAAHAHSTSPSPAALLANDKGPAPSSDEDRHISAAPQSPSLSPCPASKSSPQRTALQQQPPPPSATAAPAFAPGVPPLLPRIFISIASYRDPETRWTVRDLFARATHPGRVYVGIAWQVS